MNKKIKLIFIIVFLCLSNQSWAQTFIEHSSQKFCDCLENNKIKTLKASELCMESILIDNIKELKSFYKVERLSDEEIDDFVKKLMADLYVNCPYAMDMLSNLNEIDHKEVTIKQHNLKCDDIKKGDYYYLPELNSTNKQDTIFISMTDKFYIERMNKGRNYSILNITWKDDCKFDLKFIESNDKFNKELSKKIDLYRYEIIINNKNSIILKSIDTKNQGQFELIKIK